MSPSPVLVMGCGLIGTSLALALTEAGVEVHLDDILESNVELAVARGAGTADPVDSPALVVVAVPPTEVAACVAHALATWPEATVTDVASVKATLQAEITPLEGSERYVGSHPMAGSERSGPMAAYARLFEGRPVGCHLRCPALIRSQSPESSRLPSWSAPYRWRWMPRRTTVPWPSCPTCRTYLRS